jgi:hypothetical protein
MSDIEDGNQKDTSKGKDAHQEEISAEYTTKFYHEESMISGFLHVKIQRLRNLMRVWKSATEKGDKDNSEEQDVSP